MPTELILASASPRRRELLAQIGYRFTVMIADIDESLHPGELPRTYVKRLARQKAAAVLARSPSDPSKVAGGHHLAATVLAADTTVELDGVILNKPRDCADAERMLRLLSGRTHRVHTGIAVQQHHWSRSHVETTEVTFAPIAEADLAHYLASGDPLDKAGGYGIQGFAARWVPRIAGDYFNVVGLPLAATAQLLAAAHVSLSS